MTGRKHRGVPIDRRAFLRRSAVVTASLAGFGPLHALGARTAHGQAPSEVTGYGPLVNKGDLCLPRSITR